MTTQENSAILATESEVEYVPDLVCPRCQTEINLNRETYEWYDDAVGCYQCKATFTVKIGYKGPVETIYGPSEVETTTKPDFKTRGGMLLEAPKLVIPAYLTEWVSSIGDSVPTMTRDEYLQAVEEYGSLRFSDAALHFRTTLEFALGDLGVVPANVHSLNRKIDIALQQNAISQEIGSLCRAVAVYGNRSAHAQPDPTTMVDEPLARVSMILTRDILQAIFPD